MSNDDALVKRQYGIGEIWQKIETGLKLAGKDIEFSEDNTFMMKNARGELLGLGQLLEKENDRIHMARVIVSPLQRAKGFGELLCRLLIDEGIKRFARRSVFPGFRPSRE
ncbi:MAG: GNAT family N-acetyltransferase [Desulfobacterales bacterium]